MPAESVLFAVPEPPDAAAVESEAAPETLSLTTELAQELRPCERLLSAGAEALSSAELLALILDGDGVDELAERELLATAQAAISELGGLAGLRDASRHELAGALPSPDGARSLKVLAAIELGRRTVNLPGPEPHSISSPADVHRLLGGSMQDLDREHFVAVLLDTRNQVLDTPTISIGTLASSLVHPREVFKPAIRTSAAGVILVHNHPAGHLSPSREDRQVTIRLVEAGRTIGIEVLDHVIVTREGYASLEELGLL